MAARVPPFFYAPLIWATAHQQDLIKNVVQPRLSAFGLVTLRAVRTMRRPRPIAVRVNKVRSRVAWPIRRRRGGRHCRLALGQINQLVQLPTVQPYASALGAVVNLNALAIHHCQNRIRANGALHSFLQGEAVNTFKRGRRARRRVFATRCVARYAAMTAWRVSGRFEALKTNLWLTRSPRQGYLHRSSLQPGSACRLRPVAR